MLWGLSQKGSLLSKMIVDGGSKDPYSKAYEQFPFLGMASALNSPASSLSWVSSRLGHIGRSSFCCTSTIKLIEVKTSFRTSLHVSSRRPIKPLSDDKSNWINLREVV